MATVEPIIATPERGGRLISKPSSAAAGIYNYAVKRDWRRETRTTEIRREGDDIFHPNLSIDIGKQPSPQDQDFALPGFSNGSFEVDDDFDGVPDDWDLTDPGSIFDLDTSVFDHGERSARFRTVSGLEGLTYLENDTLLPVGDDRRWRLEFRAKASSEGRNLKVDIRWYDENGSLLETSNLFDVDAPVVWESFIKISTPPQAAYYGKLRITGKVAADTHIGDLWIDNVRLFERDASILPITALGEFRRPNGQIAVIAATATTIYRFNYEGEAKYVDSGESDGYVKDGYVEDGYTTDQEEGEYVAEGYFQASIGAWTIIGSGFSKDAQRWEVVPCGPGYIVLNNGYDLPVSYRVEHSEVQPIHEMRESGIAKVGTISEFKGILVASDVSILKDDSYEDNFAHIAPPAATKAKQYGSVSSTPHRATSFNGGAVDLGNSASGSNVVFADSADLDLSIDFAIEANVLLDQTPVDDFYYTIFGKTNSYRFGAIRTGGQWFLVLDLIISSVLTTIQCAVPLTHSDGDYVHVAVSVSDGNDIYFFQNGEEIEHQVSSFNSPDNTAGSAYCGLLDIAGVDDVSGGMRIAELRVWQDFRTIAEIRDNYTLNVTGQPSLSAYWMFNETSGTSAADSTGGGNTGTLQAGAVFVSSNSINDLYVEMVAIPATLLSNDGAGVATFVSGTVHGYSTGQKATITGAATADYNLSGVTVTRLDDFRFTYPIAVIGAGTDAGAAEAQRAIFESGHINKRLSFFNGLSTRITEVISNVRVKVDKSVESLDGEEYIFFIISESESALTGTVTKTSAAVTLAGVGTAFTTELSVGQSIRVGTTEEVRKIASITNDTTATVDSNWGSSEGGVTAHRVTDYTVLTNFSHFTLDMVGKNIFFDDGNWRLITEFKNSRRVEVSGHRPISEQGFLIENTTAYDAISDGSKFDRIRFRTIWSAIDEPRTWESSPPGSIETGSVSLELAYQARSFERNMVIVVAGAGINGGNLTSRIRYVHPNHTTIILADPATTTVEDADVQRSDSIGSIVGYHDLVHKSSAILKHSELSGILVYYKETMIYMAQFTGDPDSPFTFRERYEGSKIPHYKYTLTKVSTGDREYHLYAGKNSFYKFDLVSQVPQELLEFEDVEDIFYNADLSDINKVFAADNPITKEVFFQFPARSGGDDFGICFDYLYRTISTTSARYTAMCAIDRLTGLDDTPSHQWFLLASPDGKVRIYGRTDNPEPQWGDRDAVFNRYGSDYESVLKSGLWGGRMNRSFLTNYVLELDSHNDPATGPVTVKIWSYKNPSKPPTLLHTEVFDIPDTENMVPTHFQDNFFQDEIVASGNAPCRIAARVINVGSIQTRSHDRRVL